MHRRMLLSVFLPLCLVSGVSAADEAGGRHPWLWRKHSLEFGAFFPERTARLKAAGTLDLSLEELVDVGSQFTVTQSDSTLAAEFSWRFGRRWSMRMQYFDSEGSNTAVLQQDVQWEDQLYLAGTQATAGTGFELTRAVWDFTLDNNDAYDFGVSIGFHWLHIQAFAEGTTLTPDGPRFRRESVSVDAPLPNIGFTYVHSLSPTWAYRARLDWFSANLDPYDGIFFNASFGFNYQLTDRIGLGFNYNHIELDVGVNGDNWRGEIEQRYAGLYAYLGVTW